MSNQPRQKIKEFVLIFCEQIDRKIGKEAGAELVQAQISYTLALKDWLTLTITVFKLC